MTERTSATAGSTAGSTAAAEITGHHKDNNISREPATAGILATVGTPLANNGCRTPSVLQQQKYCNITTSMRGLAL
jgi:hypothetical protein